MFIRKKIHKYKNKSYTDYPLVESVLPPYGPRQSVICFLGDLGPWPAVDWMRLGYKVESALVEQLDLFEPCGEEALDIVEQVRAQEDTAISEKQEQRFAADLECDTRLTNAKR